MFDVPHKPLMEISTDPRVKSQLGDPMVAIFVAPLLNDDDNNHQSKGHKFMVRDLTIIFCVLKVFQ